jgi:hypothetical protein
MEPALLIPLATAKQIVVVGQLMAVKVVLGTENSGAHSAPPLVVPISPVAEAAKHVLVLGQLIPLRLSVVPDGATRRQSVAPPSVVRNTAPPVPGPKLETAKQVVDDGQLRPLMVAEAGPF